MRLSPDSSALPSNCMPDLDAGGKQAARLYSDQRLLVCAEGVVGFELHLASEAGLLALQRLFDAQENAVVAAVQIADRRVGLFDQRSVGRQQLVGQRHDRILGDLH